MLRIPSFIQWHEGMFLSPQHFQQLQRCVEARFAGHATLLHEHHWGVFHLAFDPLTLSEGILRLSELKALMPDNTFVDYPGESLRQTVEINLAPYKDEAQKHSLKVFLAVPDLMEGQSPVIGEWPRYDSVEGQPIMDENLNDNVIYMPRLQPKLSLIISDTYPARYTSFPLAEVAFRDETFIMTDFQPPLLKIEPQTFFHDQVIELIQRMREKAQYLSDKWQKQVGMTLLNETASQLRPLITVLPILEGALRGQSLHPKTLYDLLCLTLGELSTMRLANIPPPVPAYCHDNMRYCLGSLLSLLEQLLDHIDQSMIVLPFNQRDRLFYLKMHESYLSQVMYIGLRAPSSMSDGMLFDWMKDAVIASDSSVESVRLRRISGAPRKLLDQEEMSDFFVSRGMLVFKLQYPSEFIKAGENLNIFNASDDDQKRPSAIALYLKKSDTSVASAA